MFGLSEEEIERYGRQIIVPGIGAAGQGRLKAGSVLVVGAGGLGSPALLYLAAAGVGRIGVVDADVVDVTNLQRQVAHSSAGVGRNKAVSAAETMRAINPHISVETFELRLEAENTLDTLRGWDVVLDGTDNFPTRYLVNDACVMLKIPLVTAAILRYSGQITTLAPGAGPCYRCVFPEPPAPGSVPSCSQAGILGPVAGVLGCMQALEAVKLLVGVGETLCGRYAQFDAERGVWSEYAVNRDPSCPACGTDPTITRLELAEDVCAG